MSKAKKTRQQKIIADLRRKVVLQSPQHYYTVTKPLEKPVMTQSFQKEHVYASPFLFSDLRKTMFITTVVIGIELALFFLLVKQIITIPMVNY